MSKIGIDNTTLTINTLNATTEMKVTGGNPVTLNDSDNSNYSQIKANGTTTDNYIIVLPASYGSANQMLQVASVSGSNPTTVNMQFATVATLIPTAGTEGQVIVSNGTSGTITDSNLFWNNSNKRLGVGTNNPLSTLHVSGTSRFIGNVGIGSAPGGYGLEMIADTAANWAYSWATLTRYDTNSGNSNPVIGLRRSKGTLASPAAVANGDYLGQVLFFGYANGSFQQNAEFGAYVGNTVSGTTVPTNFYISTTNNSGALTQRAIFDYNGLTTLSGNLALSGISATISATNGTNADLLLSPKGTGSVATVDSNGLLGERTVTATVNTTDATVTTIGPTITLSDDQMVYIEAKVIGIQQGTTNRATYHIAAMYYKDGAAAVLQQGSTSLMFVSESNAAWDATFVLSSPNISVRVTGAAVNIKWKATIKYLISETYV